MGDAAESFAAAVWQVGGASQRRRGPTLLLRLGRCGRQQHCGTLLLQLMLQLLNLHLQLRHPQLQGRLLLHHAHEGPKTEEELLQ